MAVQSREKILADLVDVCHRLCAKGFVTATDGNVSARLPEGTGVLTTRTAVNKGMVTPGDLVEVDPSGSPLGPGLLRPSTEIGMHLYIYSQRADIGAVVHAHPTYATGFATARQPLTGCLFPEVILGLGAIPLADYATPSTAEIALSLSPYVKSSDAILLANHGVVTYGKDLYDAYFKMEKVEHAAQIAFVARMLGGERPLSAADVGKLRAISQEVYGKDVSGRIACHPSSPAPGRTGETAAGGGAAVAGENAAAGGIGEEVREIVKEMMRGAPGPPPARRAEEPPEKPGG